MSLTEQPRTSLWKLRDGQKSNLRRCSVRHIDHSVRDNPIFAKLSTDGVVTLAGKNNGVRIQFVAAEWPKEIQTQNDWIRRLTPFWDGDNNFALKHRLRDAMRSATNKILC